MTPFNIEEVTWSAPRTIDTKVGRRRVRTWHPPPGSPFWAAWRTGYLKEQGYTLRKWRDEWQVTEWREDNGHELPGTAEATTAARAAACGDHLMENVDVDLPPAMALRFAEVEAIYERILADTEIDFRYQLPSIKRLALAVERGGGLDASDTGVGKTAVACAVAKVLARELFVVCPKAVRQPWRRIAALFDVPIVAVNYESLRTGNTPYGYAYVEKSFTRNGQPRRRRVFSWNDATVDKDNTLVVFDDCHKMKDYTTWNCLMGEQALSQGYRVLAGSATAADNPMQMKFVALLTGLIRHPHHFAGWMSEHGVRKGRWGLEFVGGRDVLARIHRDIFPARGSRIRVADLGDRFPATQIISEAYDMGAQATHEIQHVYDEMRQEIAKLEATQAKDKASCILVEQLRARQRAELLKVPTLVAMAKDAIDDGMSVVIILNYMASIQAAANRLRTQNTLTGEDKPGHRQAVIDRFNADDEVVVVMNIKLAVGIGLQGTAQGRTRLGLISPTPSAIDLVQSLGRLPRGGGAYSIQKIVWAADTVEEPTAVKVRRKIRRIETLNDGDLAV